MQCNSCSGDVPSKFSHAITQNVCPFCGDAIMEAELQKILASLHDAMADAVKLSYTSFAIDWMSSNFNLIDREGEEILGLKSEIETLKEDLKKADEEYLAAKKEMVKVVQELEETKINAKLIKPTPKSGQVKTIQLGTDELGNEVQLQGESIQDPDKTQQFLKRAQVKPQTNTEHFKKIVSQIKKGVVGGGGGDVEMMSKLGSASSEEVEAWERAMSAGSSGVPTIQSGIDPEGFDEGLPAVVEAFAAGPSSSQSGTYNARDVARAQNLQNKAQARSNAMSGGGSVGLIRR